MIRATKRMVCSAILLAPVAAGAMGLNQKEAQLHFQTAQRCDVQGQYDCAMEHYWKALVNARLAKADAATMSMLTYNYGRTAGYTCRLDVAEKYLLESLNMEAAVSGPDSGVSTKRLFELARFYFDQAQYDKAASYYKDGLPRVEKLGAADSDPVTFADAVDEYAVALSNSGNAAEASAQRAKASDVRQRHPDAKAVFVPTRYKCNR